MRTLYESILDTDDEIKRKVKTETDKIVIKEALIEFLKYLHVDVPNTDHTLLLFLGSQIYNHQDCLQYSMRNYIDWVTKVPQHGNDDWFQDKTWTGMYYTNQQWIQQALEEAFEKYLNKNHVKYNKKGRYSTTIEYEFENYSITFKLFKNESHTFQKEYDKQTKGGQNTRNSYKSYGWFFNIIAPNDFFADIKIVK